MSASKVTDRETGKWSSGRDAYVTGYAVDIGV